MSGSEPAANAATPAPASAQTTSASSKRRRKGQSGRARGKPQFSGPTVTIVFGSSASAGGPGAPTGASGAASQPVSRTFALVQDVAVFERLIRLEFSVPANVALTLALGQGQKRVVLPVDPSLLQDGLEYSLVSYAAAVPAYHGFHAGPVSQQAGNVAANTGVVALGGAPPAHTAGAAAAAPAAASMAGLLGPSDVPHPTGEGPPPLAEEKFVIVVYAYAATAQTELALNTGDRVEVLEKCNQLWWLGRIGTRQGFFPTNYVSIEGHTVILSEELTGEPAVKGDLQDAEYFDGYANLQIHWEMLHDDLRTLSYKNAVESLTKHISGKIVLDIGCGSGVLSIFCAKAGAKHVYAVDASDVIHKARQVVKANGLDNKVTLLQGKIEELKLPVDKVDVIISEWMGTLLICESMIASVLNARELYLKPEGGMLMPSSSSLFLSPVDLTELLEEKVGFWTDVYGIDMSVLSRPAHEEFFDKPLFARCCKPEEVLAAPRTIYFLDMKTAKEADLENILSPFEFVVARDGTLNGFASWFDCTFAPPTMDECEVPVAELDALFREISTTYSGPDAQKKRITEEREGAVVLSTDPVHQDTHWKHVTFIFPEPVQVKKGDVLSGVIHIERNKYWRRHFEAEIKYSIRGRAGSEVQKRFPVWR